jgi:hypothetical protein
MDSLNEIDRATEARLIPPLCYQCKTRPRERFKARLSSYCVECRREDQRRRHDEKKSDRKQCATCGRRHPGGHRCPEVLRLYLIKRGREKLNHVWPGCGDLITDESLLIRIGQNWPRVRLPLPSAIFPGLSPRLNDRLVREQRDKDIALCRAVAAVPDQDQREFLELYLVDPADAQRWHALPRWQRQIRRGNKDDQQIWKFFTMQRLNMEQAARDAPPWSMASQGAQLPQMFGTILNLSPEGIRKLALLMSAYGTALHKGDDLGNVTIPPWNPTVSRGGPHDIP